MFGPSTIELRRLFVGEHKVLLTFLGTHGRKSKSRPVCSVEGIYPSV